MFNRLRVQGCALLYTNRVKGGVKPGQCGVVTLGAEVCIFRSLQEALAPLGS